jgi:hypothetical protein
MAWFFWILVVFPLLLIVLLIGLVFQHSSSQPFFAQGKKVIRMVLPFALLGYLFMVNIYAKRHHRQIQTEDGTRTEPMTHWRRKEYLENLHRNGSKAQVYLYLSLACAMSTDVSIEFRRVWNGDRSHLLFLAFLSGFTLLMLVQAWRRRPR